VTDGNLSEHICAFDSKPMRAKGQIGRKFSLPDVAGNGGVVHFPTKYGIQFGSINY
jgi:hypothetical protein